MSVASDTYPTRSKASVWRGAVLSRFFRPLIRGIQRTRADQFARLGAVQDSIVFLGDSITEGGEWSEWFPGQMVSNRGIGGETTGDILRRLDSAVDQARGVFLLAGTNDLALGSTPHEIATRVSWILEGIALRAPGAAIYVQSVMPRAASYASELYQLNELIRQLTVTRADVEYINLWPVLSDDRVSLRKDFTFDALHLNGAGYQAWTTALRPFVGDLCNGLTSETEWKQVQANVDDSRS